MIKSLTSIKIKDVAQFLDLHPNSITNVLNGKAVQKEYTPETIKRVEKEVLKRIIENGKSAMVIAENKGYELSL